MHVSRRVRNLFLKKHHKFTELITCKDDFHTVQIGNKQIITKRDSNSRVLKKILKRMTNLSEQAEII